MRERKDPLLPLLAAAVSLVLVASIFHFYPRVTRWLGSGVAAVAEEREAPEAAVPVWVCGAVKGVALLLNASPDDERIADAFEGGPYRFLTLHVYNFASDEPFELKLPDAGLASPEGGEPALPAARFLKEEPPAPLRPVLLALGAVPSLRVPKGHEGKALFALRGDPAKRTAFVSGELTFERKVLERRVLAQFEQRPDAKQFEDF